MMDDIKKVVKEAKDYVNVKKDIVKMKTAETVSAGAGNAIAYAVLGVIGLFTLLFLSVSLALGIGWALDNNFWGFLIVTGIYAVTGVVVWLNKEAMFRIPVLNALLDSLFKGGKSYDEGGEHKAA